MRSIFFTWSSPVCQPVQQYKPYLQLSIDCAGGQIKRTKEQPVPDMDFLVYFKVGMIHFGSSPKPGGNSAWRIDGVVAVILPHSFVWNSLRAFSAEHAESTHSWPAQFAFCWAQCQQRGGCDHRSLFILQTSCSLCHGFYYLDPVKIQLCPLSHVYCDWSCNFCGCSQSAKKLCDSLWHGHKTPSLIVLSKIIRAKKY